MGEQSKVLTKVEAHSNLLVGIATWYWRALLFWKAGDLDLDLRCTGNECQLRA